MKKKKIEVKDYEYYQKKLKELELENALHPEKNAKRFKKRQRKQKPEVKEVPIPKYTTITHFSSKGEQIIEAFLKSKGIKFEYDKFFEDLTNPKTGQYLFVDFYLPDLNTCIEYNGEQHYNYVPEFHGLDEKKGLKVLSYQKYKDSLKRNYCFKKKMKLITISYTKHEYIEEILKEQLKINT